MPQKVFREGLMKMLQFAAHFLAEIQKKCIFFAKNSKNESKKDYLGTAIHNGVLLKLRVG